MKMKNMLGTALVAGAMLGFSSLGVVAQGCSTTTSPAAMQCPSSLLASPHGKSAKGNCKGKKCKGKTGKTGKAGKGNTSKKL